MASVSREEMQGEALRRMDALKMSGEILQGFEKGMLYASDDQGAAVPAGKEISGRVQRVEQAYWKDGYGILIYHLIENNTAFGPMTAMLYVSSDADEWRTDFSPLKGGGYLTYAYVESPMEDGCGSVAVERSPTGGVIRKG